ncbi:hypothetical protein OJF2_66650 [Aquisphaera giovannonii]|uniref:Uncharacterized protein n=1 Tax=Aquisphaera giovannonii TaxID=406548 RepID=A0A5B9WC20_9BACT|nr:hypothetical protein [Aquisphaera giovannonii]QEH38067.1 hypothetical protein OJF2_66650 [Aquisphaera giovannonii]
MTAEFPHQRPAPWNDPEFNLSGIAAKRPRVGRGWLELRTWSLLIVVAALWMGLLFNPAVGPLVLGTLMAFSLALSVLACAMALGLLGTGLFAAGDLLLGWLRRGSRWPED